MLKLKTRKAVLKRYKIIGNNNIVRRHAFKSHLLIKKSKKQKRKLSRSTAINLKDRKKIKTMLPYI